MKKSFQVILFSVLAYCAKAQTSEMGITIGVSSYKGDLKEHQYTTKDLHLAGGILYRHCFNNHWAFKAGINVMKISAEDSTSGDPYQEHRNLSFRSKIQELNMQFEFNFFKFQTANPVTKWSPYLHAGLTVFHFNPEANLDGDWYKLQPLGTEGQGTSLYKDRKYYKRTQVAFTFGGGFKFSLSRRFGLAIETGVRKTYTDYLDDVSKTYADKNAIAAVNGTTAALLSDRSIDQLNNDNLNRDRGNKNNKDWYMFTGVQLNYTLSKHYNDPCKPFKTKMR
ncbi:MAG: DUF6089 family protein [Bacteroidia bacterium]